MEHKHGQNIGRNELGGIQGFPHGYRFRGIVVFQGKEAIEENAISNEVTEADILIYPNPAENGVFTIKLGTLKGNSEIQIFDIGGKVIYHTNVQDQYYLNVNIDVPKGMYIVKVVNDQLSIAKRITVN